MPKISMDTLKDRLSKLMIDADRKSAQLDFSYFKQYFDEEFSPEMWKLIG